MFSVVQPKRHQHPVGTRVEFRTKSLVVPHNRDSSVITGTEGLWWVKVVPID